MWNYSLEPYANGYDFSQNKIISRIHEMNFIQWLIGPLKMKTKHSEKFG